MTQLILLVLLMSGSVAGAAIKKRFEELLPITCAGIVGIMFVFGFFGILKTGVYCLTGMCVILWLFAGYKLLREKNWVEFLKNMITPGFVIFVILYFVLGFISRDMVAKEWDEFSHWARIVKAMVQLDDFGTHPNANVIFPSYPPGMALFQYYVQKIYLIVKPEQTFSEWRLFFAFQVFFISFLMPFLKGLSFKNPIKIVMITIMVWLAPMLIFTNIYECIYIDPILGFIGGTAFALIFVKTDRDWLYDVFIYAAIAMLILMKDAGMLFAAFVLIAYIVDIFCSYDCKNIKCVINKRNVRKILLGIGSLLIPKFMWSTELKASQVTIAFSGKINLGEFLSIVLGKGPDNYRSEVFKSYFSAILERTVEIGNTSIEVSYMAYLIILLGLAVILYFKREKIEGTNKKSRKAMIILLSIVSVIFVVGMCTSYMYKFSQEEALKLAAFSRYLRIILHYLWIFCLSVLLYLFANESQGISKNDIFIFCICMLTVPWIIVSNHVTRETVHQAHAVRAPYQQIVNQIDELQGENSEPIILNIICREINWCEHLVFNYSLRPHRFEWNYPEDLSAEEWLTNISPYIKYVVLFRIDDEFVNKFESVFEDPNDIQEMSVYRINEENGKLVRTLQ